MSTTFCNIILCTALNVCIVCVTYLNATLIFCNSRISGPVIQIACNTDVTTYQSSCQGREIIAGGFGKEDCQVLNYSAGK